MIFTTSMSSSDTSAEAKASADSNQPLAISDDEIKDLLGDEGKAGGDTSDSSSSDNNDNTGNNNSSSQDEQVSREGKLRQKIGEDRKLFMTELQKSNPAGLADILEKDEGLRKTAAKHGITVEALRSSNAPADTANKVPETFIESALTKNLNKADAERAWGLAGTLKASGLSDELAQKTALEQVASGGSNSPVPASIPAGGSAASGNQDVSNLVSTTAFSKFDHEQRRAYRAKFGNKFTD